MKTLKMQKITLLAAVMIGNYSYASTTGLDGVEVEFAVYCCSNSTESNRTSDVLSAVVGSEIEYPFIENSGGSVISAHINISNSQIDVDYTKFSTTANGSFNGYVLNFKPISDFPEIESVSVNSATTFNPSVINLSFDSDTIRMSLPGQRVTPDSRILIDITFASEQASLDNECVANYTINGALNIPCISVPDAFGGANIYKADMNLVPLSNPFSFELIDAQQIKGISITNSCVATYSVEGLLNIPCVSVPDAFGGSVMYQADMELIPFSSPFTFKLIAAQKK